ncbi:MAG: hypothetical protein ACRDJC_14445, partial [Thermomicrobiales bacterium]
APRCPPATCASNSVCIDDVCQSCDVCVSGCFFSTLQAAVDAAAPEETIRVCAGIYAGDIVVNQSVRLIGAGDGLGAGNTLLQGSGTDTVVTIEAGNTVSLQSLRIAGGSTSFGGGIRNFGSLELTDCTITGNTATNFGSGIDNSGTLKLTGCTVSGNVAMASQGGGIRNDGTMTLTGCTVSGNTAGAGGGIYNFFGTGELINSTVSGNTADFGGGIFNNGGMVTLDAASRVTGNDADPTVPDSGGGIFNQVGTVPLGSADNVSGNTPDNCAPNGAVPLCQDPP